MLIFAVRKFREDMEIRQIIRFEGEDGLGLWSSKNGYIGQINPEIAARHKHFNTPLEDGLRIESKWYCGYKSIDQMTEWIQPSEIRDILEAGYDVWLIEATEYQVGAHQVIFTKSSEVSRKKINQLFA